MALAYPTVEVTLLTDFPPGVAFLGTCKKIIITGTNSLIGYLSFSTLEGRTVRELFLRSSQRRLGQHAKKDCGRVFSLFPSKYTHCNGHEGRGEGLACKQVAKWVELHLHAAFNNAQTLHNASFKLATRVNTAD